MYCTAGRQFNVASLRSLLLSDAMRPVDPFRHFVVLSLAEAETIRRIMHLRGPALRHLGVELKLRVLPLDFCVLDRVMTEAQDAPCAQLPDQKLDQSYHRCNCNST